MTSVVKDSPYCSANVALCADEEEQAALFGTGLAAALQAADTCHASLSVDALMAAAGAATRAAAAASAAVWHAYEYAVPREATWEGPPREVRPHCASAATCTTSFALL